MPNSVHEFSARLNNGSLQQLSDYKGQVLLIVNTASNCGFTPQYEGLEQLYEEFKEKNFSVLAFPCNQFGSQEPGDSEEIAVFCISQFSIQFPLFEKVDVNGDNALPLFDYLTSAAPGLLGTKRIKWNFTKFLVNQQGEVIKRYSPRTTPSEIKADIAALLANPET